MTHRPNRDHIPVERARALRKHYPRMTWRKIGALLAELDGRPVPYAGTAVQRACVKAGKANP